MTPDEAALNAYTRALGIVQTRDRDTAVKMLQERVEFYRAEVQTVVVTNRDVFRDRSGTYLCPKCKNQEDRLTPAMAACPRCGAELTWRL